MFYFDIEILHSTNRKLKVDFWETPEINKHKNAGNHLNGQLSQLYLTF